jgi:hypothetical protein
MNSPGDPATRNDLIATILHLGDSTHLGSDMGTSKAAFQRGLRMANLPKITPGLNADPTYEWILRWMAGRATDPIP